MTNSKSTSVSTNRRAVKKYHSHTRSGPASISSTEAPTMPTTFQLVARNGTRPKTVFIEPVTHLADVY
jgi:hypothetical protein